MFKMKENDWHLLWCFLVLAVHYCSFHLWNFPKWENLFENICFNFSPLFFCIAIVKLFQYSRLIQTTLSNYYCGNAFVNPKRKNYMWKLWYPNHKKQKFTAQEDVLLNNSDVSNVQISPQNHKMIWITILLRSTAAQNLNSLSCVHFVIKSFRGFSLYVNINTLNTDCKSNQEQEMWL